MRGSAGVYPLLICLLAGCQALSLRPAAPNLKVQTDPSRYTVTVVKLHVARADFERLVDAPAAELDDVLQHRTTDVKQYPPVHLLPGDTEIVDQQRDICYSAPVDPEEETPNVVTAKVGDRIEAKLELPPKSDPLLTIQVCDKRMAGWVALQRGETELRQPRFEQDVIQSSTHAPLGEWIVLGSSGSQPEGDILFLARLDRPRKGMVEVDTYENSTAP